MRPLPLQWYKRIACRNAGVRSKFRKWNFEYPLNSIQNWSMKRKLFFQIRVTFQTLLLLLATQVSFAQNRVITGRVSEVKENRPLEGVSVLIKGSNKGTQTKSDGSFKIEITSGSRALVFSFVGYLTQEIPIGSSDIINVSLVPSEKASDEVVVIGYGVARKTDVTSAISSIKEKDFNRGAMISPMSLIQGKVPGLVIVNSNGTDPNGQSSLQLRGVSTLKGSTSPFVVIDGIPGGNLNNLSPEDVESIDVLRDGSAAAIYGTRGSNGVIIVTTKRAKGGMASFNYDSYVYSDIPKDFPPVLSAAQYREYAEVYKRTNPTFVLNDGGASTNWFKELTRKTYSQVHNFSVSSGSDKSSIRAAVSVRDLQGMAISTWRKTVNTRLSFTQKALENRLSIQGNIATSFLHYLNTDNTLFGDAMDRNPTFPVYTTNGGYFEDPLDSKGNPVARRLQTEDGERIKHLNGSVKATLDLIDGLKASGFFAFQRRDVISYYYQSRDAFLSRINGQNGNASRSTAFSYDRTFEYTLDYAKRWGAHQVTALAGYSYQDFMSEDFSASNRNFLTDAMSYNNLGAGQAFAAGATGAGLGSSKSSNKLIAFFGRGMYNYNEKYLLSASVRREGSSKFGKNHKWGLFPAVSLGWRMIKEPFLSNVKFLDDLKLRLGYGVTGNQEGISSYGSLATLSTGASFLWDNVFVPTYGASRNPNPDLRWEKKTEYNIGLDFGINGGRVSGSIDLYKRITSDLLVDATAPVPSLIHQTILVNLGTMQNKGAELALNVKILDNKKINWTSSLTVSYNENLLKSVSYGSTTSAPVDHYSLPQNMGSAFRREVGQPIGNFYGKVFKEFDVANNKWVFYTQAEDAALDAQNKKILGNGMPKMFAGLSNNFSYNRFDLSVFLRGTFMYDVLNIMDLVYTNRGRYSNNFLVKGLDLPITSYAYSNYFLSKGDFIKLDNVTLGYTFNTTKIKYLKKARLYVSGQNLLTITKYSGRDPDIQINGLEPGLETMNFYPRATTVTAGVSLGF